MLTNRELATAILIAIAVALLLIYPKTRSSVGPVIRAALAPRLVILWVAYLAYSGLIVWAAFALGAWTAAMTKDAALLVLGVGVPMVFSANTVSDGRAFVLRVLRESVGVSAVLAAYLQLASFSVPTELVLQVVAIVLACLQVVAQRTPGSEAEAKICAVVLLAIGIAYIWRTTTYLMTSWRSEEWPVTGRVLGMFVWFPVALIPFTYIVAYAMACGIILTHLRIHNGMQRPRRRVRLAVVVGLHLSARLAHDLPVKTRYAVARAATYGEARAFVVAYRVQHRAMRDAATAALPAQGHH